MMRRKCTYHSAVFPDNQIAVIERQLPGKKLYCEAIYNTGNYDITDEEGREIAVVWNGGGFTWCGTWNGRSLVKF